MSQTATKLLQQQAASGSSQLKLKPQIQPMTAEQALAQAETQQNAMQAEENNALKQESQVKLYLALLGPDQNVIKKRFGRWWNEALQYFVQDDIIERIESVAQNVLPYKQFTGSTLGIAGLKALQALNKMAPTAIDQWMGPMQQARVPALQEPESSVIQQGGNRQLRNLRGNKLNIQLPNRTTSNMTKAGLEALYNQGLRKADQGALGLNSLNALTAYPQWAVKAGKQAALANDRLKSMYNLANTVFDPDNAKYKQLQSTGLANFDPSMKRWTGHAADNAVKSTQNAGNIADKINKANQLMQNTQMDVLQEKKVIPEFIKEIVSTNRQLVKTGFGAISSANGAMNLYAGRWVDPVTGRVRVLPTANDKYTNPFSYNQKVGYYQAKIINHWNSLISMAQDLRNLKNKGPQKYIESQQKKVKSSFDYSTLIIAQTNYITSKIQSYILSEGLPRSYQNDILTQIGLNKLKEINNIYPTWITKANSKNLDFTPLLNKIGEWRQAVNISFEALCDDVARQGNYETYERQTIKNKLGRAALALTGGIAKKMKNGIWMLKRAAIVPAKMTQKDILKIGQSLDTQQDAFRNATKNFDPTALSSQKFTELRDAASALQKIPVNKWGRDVAVLNRITTAAFVPGQGALQNPKYQRDRLNLLPNNYYK